MYDGSSVISHQLLRDEIWHMTFSVVETHRSNGYKFCLLPPREKIKKGASLLRQRLEELRIGSISWEVVVF